MFVLCDRHALCYAMSKLRPKMFTSFRAKPKHTPAIHHINRQVRGHDSHAPFVMYSSIFLASNGQHTPIPSPSMNSRPSSRLPGNCVLSDVRRRTALNTKDAEEVEVIQPMKLMGNIGGRNAVNDILGGGRKGIHQRRADDVLDPSCHCFL